MGLPVTVYKSTDVGAPVGNVSRPSDWLSILKACLVNGYGDKQPLGWTLEFENTGAYAAVFRNNTVVGSGGYFQIASANGSDGTSVDIDITCAKIATAVNTFIDKVVLRRLDINSGRTSGWVVIGTSRGFWMIQPSSELTASTSTGYSGGCWSVFIGDIESFDPNDMSPFCIVSGTPGAGDDTSVSYTGNLGSSSQAYMQTGCANGSAGIVEYTFDSNVVGLSRTTDINPSAIPSNAPMHLTAVVPSLGGKYFTSSTEARPIVRGVIPGFYWSSFVGGRDMTEFYHTFGEHGFRLIQGYLTPFMWIKYTGEWYA